MGVLKMQRITFTNSIGNSIESNNSAPFLLSNIEGLGEVDADIQRQRAPYQDGSTFTEVILQDRPITVEITIEGVNSVDVLEKRKFLTSIFNPKLGLGVFRYENDLGVWEIEAVAEGVPVLLGGASNRGNTFQRTLINLLCPNPYWKTIQEKTEPLSAWIGKFKFPFKFPVEFGEKANRTTINNDGDVETPVVIDFYGPAINPTVTNETTGQRIRIKRTLSVTDKLEVSTEFGNKYVEIVVADGTRTNAFHWIDLSADPILFQLALGENVISFSSDDPASIGSVNIRYKKRYVAV